MKKLFFMRWCDRTGTVTHNMPENKFELIQPGMNILLSSLGRRVQFGFSRGLHHQVSFLFEIIEVRVNPGLGDEDIIPAVDLVDHIISRDGFVQEREHHGFQ